MGTEIAVLPASSVLPTPGEWGFMLDMAGALVASGMLPAHIRTREAAVAIMLKGKELGIPPMYAFSNIVVISGKPTAQAELMLALIYRDHGDDAIRIVESTAERCVISYKRRSWTERQTNAFTMADAKLAKIVKAGPWEQYPAAMLRARCISAVARMAFPDSIGGMYTPEELGGKVRVTEDGEAAFVETTNAPTFYDRAIGAAPSQRQLAARVNTSTGEVTTPEPVSAEQLAILRQAAEYLYNEFDEHCPSDAECATYTYDQAYAEIKRRRQLGARLKRGREAQAAKPADQVVPQNTEDELEVAFPEIPSYVGTP